MLRDVQANGTGPVATATTISGITTGDYFTAFDTNLTFGSGTLETRKQSDPTVKVGATTSFLDCVYQVSSAETLTVTNASIGATGLNGPFTGLTTDIRRVFCNVAGLSTESFSSTIYKFDEDQANVVAIGSMSAAGANGATTISVGSNLFTKIAIGNSVSIAATTASSPTTRIGIVTDSKITGVNTSGGTITIAPGITSATVGVGNTVTVPDYWSPTQINASIVIVRSGLSTQVTFSTQNYQTFTGIITHAPSLGEYSWGKLDFGTRTKTYAFDSYNDRGILGICSAGLVSRYNPVRFRNYVFS